MRTPLTYYGGKQRLAPQILELLPDGPVFIEAGAGKLTVGLLAEGEPDLMWKMLDHLCTTLGEALHVLDARSEAEAA